MTSAPLLGWVWACRSRGHKYHAKLYNIRGLGDKVIRNWDFLKKPHSLFVGNPQIIKLLQFTFKLNEIVTVD